MRDYDQFTSLARSTTRSSADHRHGPLWRHPYGHIRQSELVPRQIRLPLGAIARRASHTLSPLLCALLTRPRACIGTRVVLHPIPCPLWPRLALYLHVLKALHYARLASDLAVVLEMTSTKYTRPRTTWHVILMRGRSSAREVRDGVSLAPVRQTKDIIATTKASTDHASQTPDSANRTQSFQNMAVSVL